MQTSRMAPLPDSDLVEEPFRSTLPRTMSREHSTSSQRDTTILRRILQRWIQPPACIRIFLYVSAVCFYSSVALRDPICLIPRPCTYHICCYSANVPFHVQVTSLLHTHPIGTVVNLSIHRTSRRICCTYDQLICVMLCSQTSLEAKFWIEHVTF